MKSGNIVTQEVPKKYLSIQSRREQKTPSSSKATYVKKSFVIMNTVEDAIQKPPYPARALAEKVLEMSKKKEDFVYKAMSADNVRENGVVKFKERQTKRQKFE